MKIRGLHLLTTAVVGLSLTVVAQSNLTFSGTVYATPNTSLDTAYVIACVIENGNCDDKRSKIVEVKSQGSSANFQLTRLENIEYLLLAWRDTNGSGEIDAEDELGLYLRNGQPALLKPPASKLELRLKAFDGDLDAFLEQAETTAVAPTNTTPANATPANISAGGLRGEFTSTGVSLTQYYNSATGASLPTSGNAWSISFNGNSTFEMYGLIQSTLYSCTKAFFIARTGVFQVKGNTLAFNFKKGSVKYLDSCSPEKENTSAAKLESQTYQWRLVSEAQSPLVLELTDAAGELTRLTKSN
jgi:hypothetical protein